jgi:hypothetical protein
MISILVEKLWNLYRGFQHHRAVFNAGTTAGAAFFDDAAGSLFNLYREIPGRSFHTFKVCIGDQFDVQMPADLDQFRRDNSHGTIVGGKRLVQLGHDTPDGW